jgi:hypothetical protein
MTELFYRIRTKIAGYHYNNYPGLFYLLVTFTSFFPLFYLCYVNQDYLATNFHLFLIELGLEEPPVIPEPEPIIEPVVEPEGFTTTEIIVISVVVIGTIVICGSVCGVFFLF